MPRTRSTRCRRTPPADTRSTSSPTRGLRLTPSRSDKLPDRGGRDAMRAGVGLSRQPLSAAAGHEAAAAALAGVPGLPPALVVVFASHTHDLPALTRAVSEAVHAASPTSAPGSIPV